MYIALEFSLPNKQVNIYVLKIFKCLDKGSSSFYLGCLLIVNDLKRLIASHILFKDKRVIFHCFSNGATFLYEIIAADGKYWSNIILGVILDSAPIDITTTAVERTINTQFGRYLGSLVSNLFKLNICFR